MRCESCQAEIGFWTTLRQPIPYRLQCFRCNARYKVSAPFLNILFILAVFVFAGLLPVFKVGFEEFGSFFIAPFAVFTIGVWFVIELILYRCIVSRGRLTRMDEAGQESADAAGGSTGE